MVGGKTMASVLRFVNEIKWVERKEKKTRREGPLGANAVVTAPGHAAGHP